MRTPCMSIWRTLMPCLAFGGLCAVTACGGTAPTPVDRDPPPPTVSSVTVTGGTTITVGQTAQFSATANLSDNTTQNVSASATWVSSNSGVATVSGSGLATGVAAGVADIRATHQSVTGAASLQVNPAAPPPPAPPMARFTVNGPGGTDVCRIVENSGGDFDCTFDGSTSIAGGGGPIVRWTWRYDVGENSLGPINRDNDPTHSPRNLCGEFDEEVPQNGTAEFVQMIVKLVVRDASGVESQEVRNANVRLFPRKQCNFGF